MKKSLHCAVAIISVATAFMISSAALCGCDKEDEMLIELGSEGAGLDELGSNTVGSDGAGADKLGSKTVGSDGANLDKSGPGRSDSDSHEAGSSNDSSKGKSSPMVYVHVCGCVKNPGVFAVKEGTRVVEVIEAAGGYTYEADEEYLNLASIVADGQKIYVPSIFDEDGQFGGGDSAAAGDFYEGAGGEAGGYTGGATANGGITANGGASGETGGLVNINRASRAELMSVKGIGEKRADAIIEYREKEGGFTSIEDLMKVPGIKAGTFNSIKEFLTV